jgi:predicted nucleic acid-binding protein
MPELVYLDTCVIIEMILQKNKGRLDACKSLIARAKSDEILLVTSTYALIEVNKCDGMGLLPVQQSERIKQFLENPFFALRPLDRRTGECAHDLIRDHKLGNADSAHVATAIVNKIPVMYTYDGCKDKRKGLLGKNGKIGTPPLKIEMPPDPSEGTLFNQDALEKADEENEGVIPFEEGKKFG